MSMDFKTVLAFQVFLHRGNFLCIRVVCVQDSLFSSFLGLLKTNVWYLLSFLNFG